MTLNSINTNIIIIHIILLIIIIIIIIYRLTEASGTRLKNLRVVDVVAYRSDGMRSEEVWPVLQFFREASSTSSSSSSSWPGSPEDGRPTLPQVGAEVEGILDGVEPGTRPDTPTPPIRIKVLDPACSGVALGADAEVAGRFPVGTRLQGLRVVDIAAPKRPGGPPRAVLGLPAGLAPPSKRRGVGAVVVGVVANVTNIGAMVDVGTKRLGMIPVSRSCSGPDG